MILSENRYPLFGIMLQALRGFAARRAPIFDSVWFASSDAAPV